MKISKLSFLIWAALLIQLTTGFFSEGFHHFDEHFQIFEFMNFKLGGTPQDALPWEFRYQMRSWLLPGLILPLSKLYFFLGFQNPFALATLIRILFTIFSFFATHLLLKSLREEFTSESQFLWIYALAQLSWFVPYIHARTSSENASLALLMIACSFIIPMTRNQKYSLAKLLWSGFFLGLCFHIRYQMAFALLGLLSFIVVYHRKLLMPLTFGSILALALGVAVDGWGYGDFSLPAWNYFHENIIYHKSSYFGVTPWWDYFRLLFLRGIPPLSIVYMVSAFYFWWKFPRHIFSWITVPFFLGHVIIGHKELRFLFFLIAIGPIQLGYLLPYLKEKISLLLLKRVGSALIFINAILLLSVMFTPAQSAIGFYRYLFQQKNILPNEILSLGGDPTRLVTLRPWFYVPKTPTFSETTLEQVKNKNENFWIFLNRGEDWVNLKDSKACQIQYSSSPLWIWNINWAPLKFLQRSRAWIIASCGLSTT